ncbi:Calcineurin-like phosphoesterase [Dehalogenimonas alkenigignens]|uniref:Calcineurin-like phosphoesterase n=1 Tax=Dehalogenimonas alkenigignens TaxID=1217799 RepID=A0A0W0GGP7_9CHLR|nr:metallophosphoesterase [Dehalogenimonas alkenigignens]KTB47713.1 Calcineurin-like phosphoesterase [Dehalogenimonas alkenigignens]
MKTLLLHLSDIHLQQSSNIILNRISNLASSLNLVAREVDDCYCVLSGDIAFSGKNDEYQQAEEFLRMLKQALEQVTNINNIVFILAPGNHDCDFSLNDEIRETLLTGIVSSSSSRSISPKLVEQVTQVQNSFFKFASLHNQAAFKENRLWYEARFPSGKHTFVFVVLNTAWMSSIKETYGSLFFPTEVLTPSEKGESIRICVFHHPGRWFNEKAFHEFRRFLDSHYDLVLTGHEHDQYYSGTKTIEGKSCEYIEGGILQGKSDSSSFNAIVVDTDLCNFKLHEYSWEINSYVVKKTSKDWQSLSDKVFKPLFYNTAKFSEYLQDLGLTFSHPRKDKLTIDDVFVDPEIFLHIVDKTAGQNSDIRIDNLLEVITKYNFVILIGGLRTGKSVLLKRTYSDLLANNIVPLWAYGAKLPFPNEDNIRSYIRHSYEEQYGTDKFDDYDRLPLQQRAVVIDDLHKSNLKPKGKIALLKELKRYFGYILVSGNNIIDIEEFLDNNARYGTDMAEFARVTIAEYGYRLRSKLLGKWLNAGDPDSADIYSSEKYKQLENIINDTLNRPSIPRTPFYIMIILQAAENKYNLNAASGSNGYYYQVIINDAILKTKRSNKDIDIKVGYLSRLAYYMFKRQLSSISAEDMLLFNNNEYLALSGLLVNCDQILMDLVEGQILRLENGYYKFQYSYYAQYFAAMFMANNIQQSKYREEVKRHVIKICNNIHKEHYLNIIEFLYFMSKDPLIAQTIIDNANKIFTDVPLSDLHQDIRFINDMQANIKTVRISSKPVEETRGVILKAQEEDQANIVYNMADVEEFNELELVGMILYAFASINIFGEIIRNYMGTTDIDCIQPLTEESYKVGLRTLSVLLKSIENGREEIVEEIKQHVKTPLLEHELVEELGKRVFYYSAFVALAVIRTLSHSLGASELTKIYQTIYENNPLQSVQLINLTIRIEQSKYPPVDYILALAKELEQNHFALELLLQIVVVNMSLYSWPIEARQKVVAGLKLQEYDDNPKVITRENKLFPGN